MDEATRGETNGRPTHFELMAPVYECTERCSTCSIQLFGHTPDAQGRCLTCEIKNAVASACCGFLYEGEACTCAADALIDRCIDCCEPTHASDSNDDGLCKRCMWRRGIKPVLPAQQEAA